MSNTQPARMLEGFSRQMLLPGTLSLLRQKRHKRGCPECARGGHGPYWYLTWKENGKSHALYIPPAGLSAARQAVMNMNRLKRWLKEYMGRLAGKNLIEFQKQIKEKGR